MGTGAGLERCFLGGWRREVWVVQRGGCGGGGGYVVVDEVGDGGGGDVVDEGEGGEEENGCGTVFWEGRLVGGKGQVGGGEHEFLVCKAMVSWIFRNIGFGKRRAFTPLLGSTLQSRTASITLPFSSLTSFTQSVFPVATSMCVANPFTWP